MNYNDKLSNKLAKEKENAVFGYHCPTPAALPVFTHSVAVFEHLDPALRPKFAQTLEECVHTMPHDLAGTITKAFMKIPEMVISASPEMIQKLQEALSSIRAIDAEHFAQLGANASERLVESAIEWGSNTTDANNHPDEWDVLVTNLRESLVGKRHATYDELIQSSLSAASGSPLQSTWQHVIKSACKESAYYGGYEPQNPQFMRLMYTCAMDVTGVMAFEDRTAFAKALDDVADYSRYVDEALTSAYEEWAVTHDDPYGDVETALIQATDMYEYMPVDPSTDDYEID